MAGSPPEEVMIEQKCEVPVEAERRSQNEIDAQNV